MGIEVLQKAFDANELVVLDDDSFLFLMQGCGVGLRILVVEKATSE